MQVAALSCLTYSYFQLFLHLKKHVTGQKFHEDEDVKNEVTTRLSAQAAEFFDIETQKLLAGLNRCLDRGGDYVEKQLKFCVKAFFLSTLLINILGIKFTEFVTVLSGRPTFVRLIVLKYNCAV